MFVIKSSSCVVKNTCFLCLCLRLLILFQGVGKFVRLYVFELHHRANTSLCDDLLKICAYYSIINYG